MTSTLLMTMLHDMTMSHDMTMLHDLWLCYITYDHVTWPM